MNKIKNIAEAKALVEKYRSITAEDINNIDQQSPNIFKGDKIMNMLTGFGDVNTCPLCKNIKMILVEKEGYYQRECHGCIHYEFISSYYRYACNNGDKYEDIEDARTTIELLEALKNRADYIESLINIYESK